MYSAQTFRYFFWQRFLPIFNVFLAQSEQIPSKVRVESEEVLGLGLWNVRTDIIIININDLFIYLKKMTPTRVKPSTLLYINNNTA